MPLRDGLDDIILTERNRFFWLFFRFSGRIDRAVFVLGYLLWTVAALFPLYKFTRVMIDSGAAQATTAEELVNLLARSGDYGGAAETWSIAFLLVILVASWSQTAFGVKRLHDFGRPAIFAIALFIPVIQFFALAILCVMPGNPGPNRFGAVSNAPA